MSYPKINKVMVCVLTPNKYSNLVTTDFEVLSPECNDRETLINVVTSKNIPVPSLMQGQVLVLRLVTELGLYDIALLNEPTDDSYHSISIWDVPAAGIRYAIEHLTDVTAEYDDYLTRLSVDNMFGSWHNFLEERGDLLQELLPVDYADDMTDEQINQSMDLTYQVVAEKE